MVRPSRRGRKVKVPVQTHIMEELKKFRDQLNLGSLNDALRLLIENYDICRSATVIGRIAESKTSRRGGVK